MSERCGAQPWIRSYSEQNSAGLVGPTCYAPGNRTKEARNIERALGFKASLHVKMSLAPLTRVWNVLTSPSLTSRAALANGERASSSTYLG